MLSPYGQIHNATEGYNSGKLYWRNGAHQNDNVLIILTNPVLTLIQVYSKHFQLNVFDTLSKLIFVCPFLQTNAQVQVLVMNILQQDLVIEACPLPKERFLVFKKALWAPVVYVP